MSSQIIYNSISAEALAKPLLTKTDEEMLLRSTTSEQVFTVLQNSPLVDYLTTDESKNIATLEKVTEKYLLHFKNQTKNLSVSNEVQKILWGRYDFHNLSVLIKAKVSGKDFSEIGQLLSTLGFYDEKVLYTHFITDTLNQLDSLLHEAYHKAYWHAESGDVSRAELEVEKCYWLYCKNNSVASQDTFVQEYQRVVIDLHNIFTNIRAKNNNRIDFSRYFISGGNYGIERFSNTDSAIDLLENFGGIDRWRSGIEECVSKGEGLEMELIRVIYLLEFISLQTKTIFSVSHFIKDVLKVQFECRKVIMLAIVSLYKLPEEKISRILNN